jgi:hypothetical protein
VRHKGVQICGTILWETKSTQQWNDNWIRKLKGDQRERNAELAVLASVTLPAGVEYFDMVEGVWVTSLSVAPHLAEVLRVGLIEVATSKLTLVDRDHKIGALFEYFTSPQFKQRLEPIVEALCSMQEELNREKRAIQSSWARRQREIDEAFKGAAGLYGDIRGIVGPSLAKIESLQLPAGRES